MVELTLLYKDNDPYCHQALEALEYISLEEEFRDFHIALVDVQDDHKDYPRLPVALVNNRKVYQGEENEDYTSCKEKLRNAMLEALKEAA